MEIHFADEEGDPYAVELAGRLGGYVIGKDSDFVIFHSDGYKGYIPLDEMTWHVPSSNDDSQVPNDDDEFQTVRKPKAKRKIVSEASQGLFPPTGVVLSLSVTSYTPQALAEHLDIPISLLPLLGALVGNDFSKDTEGGSRRIQSLFFSRDVTLYERINKVAGAIRTVISPQKRKAKLQVGSVMELIERTVNALLSKSPPSRSLSSGEIASVIDKVVNATLQYAIPKYGGDAEGQASLHSNKVCALHDAETCTILPIISRNVMRQAEEASTADPKLLLARERYLDAYRRGLFSARTMDILNTASSWARFFLEDPDLETVARSIGGPIRRWVHTILDDTVGLEAQSQDAETESGASENTDDDDEIIDVVESDSDDSHIDYLAPLKGELQRLHGSDEESTDPPVSITPHRRFPIGRPLVTEYFRSGTRIASEAQAVMPISEILSSISLPEFAEDDEPPLVLRSEDDRLTVLLRALKSDYPTIRSLSPSLILPVLAIRWVLYSLHSRFVESESRTREHERWTRKEAQCFLSSFAWTECSAGAEESAEESSSHFPPIENRNVQLMAQVLMALETIEQLVQVLLLTTRVKGDFHRLSGRTFHTYLTGSAPPDMELPPGVWEAVETDLVQAFQEVVVAKKKAKRERVSKPGTAQPKPSAGNRGAFALLTDLDSS